MSDRPTDHQLALQLLRGGSFTELVERDRGIIIAAVRVVPDPGDGPLEDLEDLSLAHDTGVRTRLVFDAEGALVPDECIFNRTFPVNG